MMTINVYAEYLGKRWLFDDLKDRFKQITKQDVTVIATDFPIQDAAAYIAIRTREISCSPAPERTVVCVHDLFEEDDIYLPGGSRFGIKDSGCIVLCHPLQRGIIEQGGIDLSDMKILERPLGALSVFEPAKEKSSKFTIGWVGRNHWRKRIAWFITAIENLQIDKSNFEVILLGMDLQEAAATLKKCGVACRIFPRSDYPISAYPDIYKKMNCLVITGITEAGPLTLFEALATGIPVVSTKVGWAPYLSAQAPDKIKLVDNPGEISEALQLLFHNREQDFTARFETKKIVEKWLLEDWVTEVLDCACFLAQQYINKSVAN